MKILIILIFSFLLVGKIHAQATTPDKKDDKNVRQGLWTVFYTKNWQETTTKDSIVFYSVGELKDGQFNGVCIDYEAKTNQKKNELTYVNGVENGLAIYYQTNGKLSAKGKFLAGKKDGIWNWYYPSGKIESEYTFLAGKREGKYKKLSEKGEILEEYVFENDQKKETEYDLLVQKSSKLFEEGKFVEVLATYEKIKTIVEKEFGKKHENYASTCTILANLYQKQGDYTKAEALHTEVVSVTKSLGINNWIYVSSLHSLATLYLSQGKYERAETSFKEVENIYKQNLNKDDSLNYSNLLDSWGNLHNEQSKYVSAEALYQKSLDIRQKKAGKNSNDYASSLQSLGTLYKNKGDFIKAEAFYKQSLSIKASVFGENHLNLASILESLGNLYFQQGNYDKAETLFLQVLNIRKKSEGKNHKNYINTLNNLSVLYSEQSYFTDAEPYILEMLALSQKNQVKNSLDYANVLNTVGAFYARKKDYIKALSFYTEALSIRKQLAGENSEIYAVSLSNLAQIYSNTKKYEQAEKLSLEAISIQKKIFGENHATYKIFVDNLAIVYEKQGKYQQAAIYYQKASQVIMAQIDNNIAHLSEKEKSLYFALFSYDLEAYNAFTTKANKEIPALTAWSFNTSLTTKGLLFSSSQKMRERIQNSDDKALKKLYENWKDTRTKYAKALQMSENDRKKANISTEKLQTEANELEKSLSLKSELFAKTNDKTKYTWKDVQKQLKAGEVLVEVSRFRQPKETKVFNFIGKGIFYIPTNDGNYEVENTMGEDTPAYKAGMRAGDVFVEINGKTTKGKTKEEIARLLDPKECTFKVQSVTNKVKETRIKTFIIKADSIFKTKTIYEPSYMALIITPTTQNQPEMVVLPNGTELETDAVAYYKNNIKFKKEDKVSYNAFWAQIADKIYKTTPNPSLKVGEQKTPLLPKEGQGVVQEVVKKVYFVPDGVYHQINLVTLQNPATKAYLRSETQVQLLSSSKDLIKYAENSKKQRKNFKDYQIHLFGYPNYAQKNDKITSTKEERSLSFSAKMDTTQRFFDANSGTITILEGTKVEINNISKILFDKKIKVTNYLENQAEEGTIKALKNPDILHIATHGFFLGDTEGFDKDNADKFRENPLLRSGLLLKDAEKGLRGEIKEGEDGVLTAQEALNLNLDDTELVVMSACETGLGEIKNGEGVYGLQRSFQQAGAKTILMSLWKVDDVATQEVMTLFYGNLAAGKTKRQAFDEAQETLFKKYKNPYFWGAFVMVGE